ncbi:hypothetical protein KXV64_006054 [Aspergillus fumigatus]|nr:hypothetical protein KXV64_006054 [Aspergillus fumigatus]
MKFTALLCTLIAATAVSASTVPRDEFQIQDTCGSGYGGDQRRTNSPCKASNGDRHFCGCDRTGVTAMLPPATVPMMAQPGARAIPMELEW